MRFAPSIIKRSSLLMAMNCQPSAMRMLGLLDAERVDARRDADLFARREDRGERFLEHIRMRRLAVRAAHARGQIIRADEDGVDAGDREDLLEVAHRLDVLALEDDRDFVVRLGVVVGRGPRRSSGHGRPRRRCGCRVGG